jgi:SPP1 gp7 family putative phage head morphogenesis protein
MADALFDANIQHAVGLEQLKKSEVNKIVRMLNNEVLPEVVGNLDMRLKTIARTEFGLDVKPGQTARWKKLVKSNRELLTEGLRRLKKPLVKDLEELAKYEHDWQLKSLETFMPFNVQLNEVPVSLLRSLVVSRPFQGALLNDWWEGIASKHRTAIERQLRIGMVQGESIPELRRRIIGTSRAAFRDGTFAQLRRDVTATVRTAVNHVVNHAREETFKENEKYVKRVRYTATLDARTTDICASLDGREFEVNKGPRPPMHHQCRSTVIPVLEDLDRFKKYGFDIEKVPQGDRAAFGSAGRGPVNRRETYGTWLKKQPDAFQDKALGPRRAELFRSGKVPITRFVDEQYRPLTLKQIRQREGLPQKT